MSGITLAIMNIAEYYEMVLLYGIFFLFFVKQYVVELDHRTHCVCCHFLSGSAVGQRQRPCQMENTPL